MNQALQSRRPSAVAVLVAVIGLVLFVTQLPTAADHGPAHSPIQTEMLVNVPFSDPLDVKMKTQTAGHTHVVHTRDPSNVVMVKITVEPGAQFPWHVHNGPVLVAVKEGALVYVDATECEDRVYAAGSAFVDTGNHVHSAYNPGDTPTVLYATFLGVTGSPTIPVPEPDRTHCDD